MQIRGMSALCQSDSLELHQLVQEVVQEPNAQHTGLPGAQELCCAGAQRHARWSRCVEPFCDDFSSCFINFKMLEYADALVRQ